MTLHYAANITLLWPDRPPLKRIPAAAAAGFTRVEMLFPQTLDCDDLVAALSASSMQMSLFDFNAGDWDAGERGIAALAGRVDEFRENVPADLELARALGTKTMTVLAGIGSGRRGGPASDDVLVSNLCHVADLAGDEVTITLEAINNRDVPGYHVRTVGHAAAIVAAVDRPNVRIQLDQYHVAREFEDPISVLERHFAEVGHVQIADAPGRHEPGTGEAPIRRFLERLDQLGYEGNVGLEYIPVGDTDAGLRWLASDARGA